MYAKLINGILTPAPSNICKGSTIYQNYNLDSNSEMLLADGYKPVEETQPPTGMKLPRKYYVENEEKIISVYTETYVEPNYREKRATEYPDFREYLDAMVKINSTSEELISEGKTQLQNYYNHCLDVKAKYPKA